MGREKKGRNEVQKDVMQITGSNYAALEDKGTLFIYRNLQIENMKFWHFAARFLPLKLTFNNSSRLKTKLKHLQLEKV